MVLEHALSFVSASALDFKVVLGVIFVLLLNNFDPQSNLCPVSSV